MTPVDAVELCGPTHLASAVFLPPTELARDPSSLTLRAENLAGLERRFWKSLLRDLSSISTGEFQRIHEYIDPSSPSVEGCMIRTFGAGLLLCISAAAADEPKPSLMDKLDRTKVPAAVRPGKAMPKEVLAVLGQRGDKVDCFAFRGDGRFLAISGPDQGLRIWDVDGMKLAVYARQPDSIVCLAFSADQKRLAAGDAGGAIRIFEKAETRAPVLRTALAAHKDGPVCSLAFSPNGKMLATGGRDRAVRLWDLTRPKPTAVALAGHEDGVECLAFAADGKRLYSVGGDDEQLRVWDLSADKPKADAVVKVGGRVTSLALAPDRGSLATAGAKGASKLWSLKDGKPEDPIALETGGKAVSSIGFAPDGDSLAGIVEYSATDDRLFIWNTAGKKKHEFSYDSHLLAAGFSPDGRHLVVITETNVLIVRLPKQP